QEHLGNKFFPLQKGQKSKCLSPVIFVWLLLRNQTIPLMQYFSLDHSLIWQKRLVIFLLAHINFELVFVYLSLFHTLVYSGIFHRKGEFLCFLLEELVYTLVIYFCIPQMTDIDYIVWIEKCIRIT